MAKEAFLYDLQCKAGRTTPISLNEIPLCCTFGKKYNQPLPYNLSWDAPIKKKKKIYKTVWRHKLIAFCKKPFQGQFVQTNSFVPHFLCTCKERVCNHEGFMCRICTLPHNTSAISIFRKFCWPADKGRYRKHKSIIQQRRDLEWGLHQDRHMMRFKNKWLKDPEAVLTSFICLCLC